MNPVEIRELAAGVPLFTGLSGPEVQAICGRMIPRKFKAGDMIVHQDDEEGQTFFIIASGAVHVCIYTGEGKQSILATLHRGQFFGEMSLLDREPRSASVVAARECELFMLYRREFLDLLQRYPKMTVQMLTEMSRRLRKADRYINTLSLLSVYGRVADVILQLSKERGRRSGGVVVIPDRPTHQTIADMAGTSRETVSRILSQLRKKQLIAFDGRQLLILDETKLYE
jgi:CRP/FNR family cyclic AMP-dependent transcriptional regulator